jgi:hypothetical protein
MAASAFEFSPLSRPSLCRNVSNESANWLNES